MAAISKRFTKKNNIGFCARPISYYNCRFSHSTESTVTSIRIFPQKNFVPYQKHTTNLYDLKAFVGNQSHRMSITFISNSNSHRIMRMKQEHQRIYANVRNTMEIWSEKIYRKYFLIYVCIRWHTIHVKYTFNLFSIICSINTSISQAMGSNSIGKNWKWKNANEIHFYS
jgi:hypothetical protein